MEKSDLMNEDGEKEHKEKGKGGRKRNCLETDCPTSITPGVLQESRICFFLGGGDGKVPKSL